MYQGSLADLSGSGHDLQKAPRLGEPGPEDAGAVALKFGPWGFTQHIE
jgi:hypothetical protein